jgi:hypothetical protein
MEVKFKEDDYKFLSLEGLRNYHKTILELISNTKTKILAKNIHIVGENEELKADGGSWASAFSGAGLGTIYHNTTLYDVFNKLLRQEKWYDGSVTLINGSYHITSLSTPSNSTSLNACYEIGATVNISQTTVSALSGSPQEPYYKFTGFSAGYVTNLETGEKAGPGNPPDITYVTETLSPKYTLTRTKNSGFSDKTEKTVTKSSTNVSDCKIDSHNEIIALGTNKFTYAYKVEGAKYKYTVSDTTEKNYYVLSSFGNLYKDNSTTPYDVVSKKPETTFYSNDPNGTITATSKTISTTGVYPIFNNAVSKTANNTVSAETKVVTDSNSFVVEYGPEAFAFNMFVYPASHTLSKVEIWNPNAGAYGDYTGGSVITTETKKLLSGDKSYSVWTRQGDASEASTKFRFTLNKKTSVE